MFFYKQININEVLLKPICTYSNFEILFNIYFNITILSKKGPIHRAAGGGKIEPNTQNAQIRKLVIHYTIFKLNSL